VPFEIPSLAFLDISYQLGQLIIMAKPTSRITQAIVKPSQRPAIPISYLKHKTRANGIPII